MSKTIIALMSAVLGAVPMTVAAQALDGTKPMLCAARTASVCDEQANCATVLPESVNLPTFWKVDPVAKTVESRHGNSKEARTSKVSTVSTGGGRIVLQGDDEGLGWTVTITPDTGKMVLSGGRELSFSVFGVCTGL